MIVKGALSPSQMESGRHRLNTFNFVNGFSYICLGEMVIILFALRLGAPDFCIAMLGSFFFLSYLLMPLGKLFMARVGGAKAVATCWFLRNASALTVASAPFFAWRVSPIFGICVLMAGAFGFYVFRAIGVIGVQPLIGENTTAENRGRFSSLNAGLFNLSAVVMLAFIILLMHVSREIWMFEVVILMGALFGFLSAFFVWRVDETQTVQLSASKPILDDVRKSFLNPSRRKLLIASCVINASITLTASISMLALKRCYGVSDGNALFFALALFAGGMLVSYVAGLLAEETGPRPLAILFYCSQIALCLFWVIGPETFKWYYSMWPFILAGVAGTGTNIAISHYCLATIPDKERVGSFLMINGVSGVVAGVVGSVLGGGLLKWLNTLQLPPIEMFKIYFLIVMVLLAAGLFLVTRLEQKTDWEVGDVLGLAFAPRDVMALFSLYGISRVSDPDKESEDIQRLFEIKSGLSERALLSYLDSPKFALRIRALSALNEIPFGPKAEKMILRELEDGEHTTAHMAAQIAGERGLTGAIPLLRKALDSDDVYLQGKSMLALAQLRDEPSYGEIRSVFRFSSNPRIVIYGAAALSIIGDDASFKALLEKTLAPGLPSKVLCEIVYSLAQIEGQGDGVYRFLKVRAKDPASAVQHLADLCSSRETVLRLAQGIDKGCVSKAELRSFLAEAFGKLGNGKAALAATFLRSPLASDVPAELLLSMLPLAKV